MRLSARLNLLAFQLYNFLHYRRLEVFGNICLETYSPCNRVCSCCPVGYDKRPVKKMSDELFRRIIDQLAARKYAGEICFHFYNEPLLDKRLLEFVGYAHSKCPKSYIYFASNGDYVDIGTFRKLVQAGLSSIRLNQYDKEPAPNLKEFLVQAGERDKPFFIHNVKVIEEFPHWMNRAGNVPKLRIQEPLRRRCIRPERQLVINAEGKVAQCCCDYYAAGGLGDASRENVFDIWRSEEFKRLRALLREGRRSEISLCKACDWFEETIAFPLKRPESIQVDRR